MGSIVSASTLFIALISAPFLVSPALAYDGCLGAKVTACLDAISPYLSPMDYQLARQSVEKYLAGDIAGKRKAKASLTVPYHSRFADMLEPPQLLVLEYAPSLDIGEISITLRKGAGTAETDAEYRATHIYEAVLFALGRQDHCLQLATPHDFYLFLHTQVKPKLKEKKQDFAKGEFKPPSAYYGETGWIGLCGRKINYTLSGAEWGSVRADMDRKYNAYVASLSFR
jgi:hypothetical protein